MASGITFSGVPSGSDEADDSSLGGRSSHTNRSVGSSAGGSVAGALLDPVLILAHQCRAISTNGKTAQEIVCTASGDCKKNGHPKKREEGRQAPPGAYLPLMNSQNRMIGGVLESFMTEAEADQYFQDQNLLDREAAGAVVEKNTPGKTVKADVLLKTSPDSFSSYEEVVETAGELSVKTLVAVGKSLAKTTRKTEVAAVSPSTQKESHSPPGQKRPSSPLAKLLSSTSRFIKGSQVWYTPSRGALCVCTVMEVIQEDDGLFIYTIQTADGRQYDTIEPRLGAWTPPPPPDPVGFQAMQEEYRRRELAQAQEMQQLKVQLAAITASLNRQQQLNAQPAATQARVPSPPTSPSRGRHKPTVSYYAVTKGRTSRSPGVYSSLEAALQEVQGVSGAEWRSVPSEAAGWKYITEYNSKHLQAPHSPVTQKWYAVAAGRDNSSVGVYSSWAAAQVEVNGVSGACFARFSSQEAAQRFLLEHQLQVEQQQKRSGSRAPTGESNVHPEKLNWLGGRTSEPDKPEEGKVFGIEFVLTEGQLREKLVPDARYMSAASTQHLCEQFLDFCAQPSTVESVVSENADNNALLSRALSSLTGQQNDITLGGAPADHNWRSLKRITFCDLKNRAMLEDRLKDLQDGQYLVQTTTKNNIASVLIKAGYDPLVAREWTSQSYLYQMSVQGLEFYIRLHQRILTLILNDDGSFDQAKLEIDHHSKALRSIRTTYGTRIQVLAASYAYLRDQVASSFRSVKLQEHVQRAQTKLITKQANLLQSIELKLQRLESKGGGGGAGDGGGTPTKCFKCGSHGVHPGGRNECPWKDLSNADARAKAKEALENKRRATGTPP